ncbi:membrane protein [Burkholderia arboris]|uniref:Membrane protein n=1 Tax=Burkholderia arboris TaxID=488730 RepID=A0A9Q9SRV3_9BURK|nr:membrane protein [Burkholderia arboris]
MVAASATLVLHRDGLWSRELAALSPVPAQAQALDARLRADVGAPDVRYLVVISASTEQAALEGAEKVAAQLQPLIDRGVLAGFESPARYLPSDAAQRARQASLPDAHALAARMRDAVANQPIAVKPDLFAPFLADVDAARHAPLLTRADLRGTSLALAVDALLTERDGRWSAMLPLRAPDAARATLPASGLDATPIRAAVARAGVPDALFVDMKAEADRLYVSYVHEDIRLSLAGFAAIAMLLLIALRSPRRVVRALAPLVAAVLVVTAGFALAGVQLTILHLVGMLLIVAVGSNYALFFCKRDDAQPVTPNTLVSLLIANLATVAGFGLLALSRVPLLETFGLTVGPGAMLALAFAAILAPRATAAGDRQRRSPA